MIAASSRVEEEAAGLHGRDSPARYGVDRRQALAYEGTMIPTPWKWFTKVDGDAEVLALLSYLPLARWAALPRFMRHSFEVQEQLKTSRGLVGYSLQAQLMSRKFWTLSAWTDADALREFVRHSPHDEIMKSLAGDMHKSAFVRYHVKAATLPLRWTEAKARMAQQAPLDKRVVATRSETEGSP